MPLFLLTQWRWLLPTAVAVVLGAMLLVAKLQLGHLHLQIAQQNAKATQLLADLTAAVAAKDAAQSEFSRSLDEAHENAAHAITEATRIAEHDYAERLRIAASRPRSSCPGTAEATHPSGAEDAATQRRVRLLEEVGRDLAEVRGRAEELRSLYNGVCVPWAQSVGR